MLFRGRYDAWRVACAAIMAGMRIKVRGKSRSRGDEMLLRYGAAAKLALAIEARSMAVAKTSIGLACLL